MSQRRRKLEPIFLFFVKIRYFSCNLKIIGNRIDLTSNCDVLDCSVVAPCHLLMKSSTKDWVLVRNIVGKTFRCYYSNRQYFSSYKLFIRRNSGLLVQHLDNLENAIKKKGEVRRRFFRRNGLFVCGETQCTLHNAPGSAILPQLGVVRGRRADLNAICVKCYISGIQGFPVGDSVCSGLGAAAWWIL